MVRDFFFFFLLVCISSYSTPHMCFVCNEKKLLKTKDIFKSFRCSLCIGRIEEYIGVGEQMVSSIGEKYYNYLVITSVVKLQSQK